MLSSFNSTTRSSTTVPDRIVLAEKAVDPSFLALNTLFTEIDPLTVAQRLATEHSKNTLIKSRG